MELLGQLPRSTFARSFDKMSRNKLSPATSCVGNCGAVCTDCTSGSRGVWSHPKETLIAKGGLKEGGKEGRDEEASKVF